MYVFPGIVSLWNFSFNCQIVKLEKMNKAGLFVISLMAVFYGVCASAQVMVSGKVVDNETQKPLQGAAVHLLGSDFVALTDEDGAFRIEASNKNAVYEVSYVGMRTKKIPAKENQLVTLFPADNVLLDELVVVAYGQSTKATFTGSLVKLQGEELANRQVSNVSQLLSGVAGVESYSESGQPGLGASIRIRGIGSVNADSSPLYIVDGMPFDGQLASLNTSDIENVSVLKDAASTALYGSRGANGVIIITTKKGKEGKAKIDFNSRIGVNSRALHNYDVIKSPQTYLETVYQAMHNAAVGGLGYSEQEAHAAANMFLPTNQNGGIGYSIYTVPDGEPLIGPDGKLNPNAKLGYTDGKYYYLPDDWQSETFRNGLRQQYDMSVSGGKERFNYYLSLGYLNDEGIINNSGLERITFRTKVEGLLTKWLKVGSNMSYSIDNSNFPSGQTANYSAQNAFFMANAIAPVYPLFVRDANGEIMKGKDGMKIYDYGDGTSSNGMRSFMPLSNPVADLTLNKEKYQLGVFSGRWNVSATPFDGFTLTAQFGMNVDNTRYNRLRNPLYGASAPYGSVFQQQTETRMLDYQYIANYSHSLFVRHYINIMVGYDGYEWTAKDLMAQGNNLYLPFLDAVGNTIDQKTGNGYNNSFSTAGFVSRINYDFANTYFASISYRRDGSSRFDKDHRWGNFYSLSAAWVVSNEPFMAKMKSVDFLKLKASYGKTGNDNVRNYYAYADQYYLQGNNRIFSDGSLYYKGNNSLTWEKSASVNVGVDFVLFHGLLGGSVEYFSRKVTDMLYNTPVAPSSGYVSINKNIGSMTNSGLDVSLTSTLLNRKNLKWTISANATVMKNRINSLPGSTEGKIINGDIIYEEGKSMLRMYLVKYAGVDPETGEALYWARNGQGEYTTSDWTEANATNRQGTEDFLPSIYGGLGTCFMWQGFDLSLQCSYQLGGKIYDEGYRSLMHNGVGSSSGMNWHNDILQAWTPQNKSTDIPRLSLLDRWSNADSDRWIASSDYFSLNNLTIGYTIPKRLLGSLEIDIDKVRLFFSAENLAFVSARKGLNPRQSMDVGHAAAYSPMRSFTGGINVTF